MEWIGSKEKNQYCLPQKTVQAGFSVQRMRCRTTAMQTSFSSISHFAAKVIELCLKTLLCFSS